MRVGHLMYAPDFRRLKGRLAAIDHSQLDPNILGFLVKANCSDELVTIWSCEGHKGSRRWNTGYVMFGVRDQDHIYKLYDLIRKEFGEHQHLVGLTMTTRLNFTIPKNPRTGLYEWFAVWNLSWKKNTKFTREQGWAAIEAAGVNFLNWLEGPKDYVVMEREDIFEKFINSVNVNAVDPFNPEVQITSRTIQGFAFGLEANFQVRYCCGGYYMGGWIGQMKFRIYGNYNGWVCYTSPIDDNLDLGIAQLKVAAAALSQDEVLNVHEMAGSDIKILYEVMHIRLKDIRLEK